MRIKGSLSLTVEEVERAKALSALGRSYRAIARELKRSPHTIKRALTSSAQIAGEVQVMKKDLASSFEGLANRMVDSITDADILELDAYKRTLSGAIATDKCQLLRGLPTENINIQVLHDVIELIRAKRDADERMWEQAHALPAPATVQRVLPAPSAEPIPTPAPVLASAKKAPVEAPGTSTNQSVAPTPSVRVKYYTPIPVEKDSENENPLMRGLRNP